MIKKLIIPFVILTIALCDIVYAEEALKLKTTNTSPKYELITSVTLGPFIYDSNDNTEFPCRYRAIVSTFEIYDDLFIEKLLIDNEEGIPQGIEWSRRLDLGPLFDKLKIPTEQQNIDNIKWLSPTSLQFNLGGKVVFLEDIRQLEIIVKPN